MASEQARRSRTVPLLLGAGVALGLLLALAGQQTVKYTSSNAFCAQACHAHQESAERWIESTHYANKRGVVASCVECHLPPEGAEFLVAKLELGARDLYATLFKDVSKMDWESRRTVEAAATFTYDASCVQCHENLFAEGLSKKKAGSTLEYRDGAEQLWAMDIVARRMEAHQYYLRNTERLRCINCHLGAGHSISPREELLREAAVVAVSEMADFPVNPPDFRSYTEVIPATGAKFRMIAVPGGAFQMGSPDTEPSRRPDEGPVRDVTLTQFWMGQVEVTWEEFDAFVAQRQLGAPTSDGQRADPMSSYFGTLSGLTGKTYRSPDQRWGKGSRPVLGLTHAAATLYTEWLSEVTGKRYRLPTEAEWEYAYRAGTTGAFPVPTDASVADYAIYRENSGSAPHPTGTGKPNAWGLYGMMGNARELCLDWYAPDAYAQSSGSPSVDPRGPPSGTEHVIRGGSFRSSEGDLRAAARGYTRSEAWSVTDPRWEKSPYWYTDVADIGFRVVREFEGTSSGSHTSGAR
jgi:formylglycine-generating enzyme required for sulfatase activity